MFNLFKKKKAERVEIRSPLSGKRVDLAEVPDEVFSQKMMGDGFAVDPSEGKAVSPAEGIIANVFPTKHAVGLRTDNGAEIIVHIGIDTVNLSGEGFEAHVAEGDRVEAGQTLVTFDLEKVKSKVPSLISPVVFSNLTDDDHLDLRADEQLVAGETVVAHVEKKT